MKHSDVLYLTSRSIEQCQPKQTKSSKIEKLKESKLNKNILIPKTLEAVKTKAKFFPLKNLFQKYVQNQFLFLKLVQYYICKTCKKIHRPLKIDYLENEQKI